MGVTDNARLLLGYIAAAVAVAGRRGDYEIESIDAAGGTQVLRHGKTGNTYRVSVVQLSGSA